MLLALDWGFKPPWGFTSTDENVSLATATSLILTSHGEVRFLQGKWVNVGMAHHIGKAKLTSCWCLAEDSHVHIQRKACGTVLGQRWAEIHCGEGHISLLRDHRGLLLGEQCWWVSAVTHGGLLSLLLVSTPRQHPLVTPAQSASLTAQLQASRACHSSPRPGVSLLSEGEGLEDSPKALWRGWDKWHLLW